MGSSRHGIQTQGRWVRSINATSVLCGPPTKKQFSKIKVNTYLSDQVLVEHDWIFVDIMDRLVVKDH